MDTAPPDATPAPAGRGLLGAAALVAALARGVPDGRLVTDPDVLAPLSHDDAEWAPTSFRFVTSSGSRSGP